MLKRLASDRDIHAELIAKFRRFDKSCRTYRVQKRNHLIRIRHAAKLVKFAHAAAFDIDPHELREWAFAQMVLGAWWHFIDMPSLYDNEVAKADIWNV